MTHLPKTRALLELLNQVHAAALAAHEELASAVDAQVSAERAVNTCTCVSDEMKVLSNEAAGIGITSNLYTEQMGLGLQKIHAHRVLMEESVRKMAEQQRDDMRDVPKSELN